MSFLATRSICCSGIWIWRGRKRQVIDTRNLSRRSPGGKLVPLVIRNSFPTPTKQEMAMDSYAVSAKYYDDAYAAEPDLVDLLFYLDLAKQFGGAGAGNRLRNRAHFAADCPRRHRDPRSGQVIVHA